jgi:RNA polymerase sigma factor (sigma-70 family)
MMTHRTVKTFMAKTFKAREAVDDTEELAQRAAAGDGAALDGLLRQIQPEVLRRCARFLPHRQDAEEAAQDVLLQVARNIHRFEGRSKFSTWLHVIIANCSRQTYRALKRRFAEQASADLPLERPDPRTTSVIAGSRIDLLDALEKLDRNKPNLVAPVVLRDICQLEYAEIAELLGVPLGTIKSRIHDGRKQVQQSLLERYS